MRRAFVICAALAALLVAGSAEAHHIEYAQAIAEMAEQVPPDHVSCGERTITFFYQAKGTHIEYKSGAKSQHLEWDRSPGVATVKKSDITIFKPDSEKSLKRWKRRSGYVDTPKARYNVQSPDIFGVMWCMDLVYTSQRTFYNWDDRARYELQEDEYRVQYRAQRTSYKSLEERVWGEAAKTRKGRVVCGETFMMFHYDSYITVPHEAVPRWDWPLTEEPGRTAMRKDMALVDYSPAGGGSVGNGKRVIFFVPPPDIFSVMLCTGQGYPKTR